MAMTREELEARHPLYDSYVADWEFYTLSYSGGREFIEFVIERNERESETNYKARLKEAININFCSAIIDLFHFYLTQKPVIRELGSLAKKEQWKLFSQDCDFKGTDFSVFIDEIQREASISGSVGILVNKPNVKGVISVEQEIERGIYPYLVLYELANIVDWKYDIDPMSGRPRLSYLKLRGSTEREYVVWYIDRWEVWELPEEKDAPPILKESDGHNLGLIPFVWAPNFKNIKNPEIGTSDLKDISRIVGSITRNLSCAEEIIKWAGFPVQRRPMATDDDEGKEEIHSIRSIVEFNPEFGEAGKPDWMETKILEPIEAILQYIDRKADEIYRMAHLSGVHGQRKSNNEVASGLALRYEFQQLTSVLSSKAESVTEAEQKIIKYWLMWQNQEELWKDTSITRSENFNIDDLRLDLQNSINAMKAVLSNKFKFEVMKGIVRAQLPDLRDKNYEEIVKEIESKLDTLSEDFERVNFVTSSTLSAKSAGSQSTASVEKTV